MINLRKLSKDDDLTYYEKLSHTFPREERYSIETLMTLNFIDIYSIEETKPMGYCVLCPSKELTYLFFLCIDEKYRGQNIGSTVLSLLQDMYPMQMVLDVEKVERSTPYESEKMKRRRFYLKNHFHLAHIELSFLNREFQVMCNQKDLSIDKLQAHLEKLAPIGYLPKLKLIELKG